MDTVYAERNQLGKVIGIYRCLQPGRAEELLAIDHADVRAFLNPPPNPRLVADAQEAEADRQDAQLQALLNMTDQEIATAIAAAFPDTAQRAIIRRLARLAQHAARGRKLR